MPCIPFESILSARIVHVTRLCTRASDSVEISRTNSRYAMNVDFTCTRLKSSFPLMHVVVYYLVVYNLM